jgi:hypothetical protein
MTGYSKKNTVENISRSKTDPRNREDSGQRNGLTNNYKTPGGDNKING